MQHITDRGYMTCPVCAGTGEPVNNDSVMDDFLGVPVCGTCLGRKKILSGGYSSHQVDELLLEEAKEST